jgi:hypothetical protein
LILPETVRQVNLFGLAPDSVAERASWSAAGTCFPTLKQSLLHGSLGFGVVGTVVFAIVRCGAPWMHQYFGVLGPYLIATALFVFLAGGILSRLVIGPGRLARFYLLFSVAFFSYAACWVIAYLTLRGLSGELLGSVTGTLLMALVLADAFGAKNTLLRLIPALLLANLAGYFLGRLLFYGVIGGGGNLGMILFGAFYGLGFGAGLGYALFLVQEPIRQRLSASSPDPSAKSRPGS